MTPAERALELFPIVADASPEAREALLAGETEAVVDRLRKMLSLDGHAFTRGVQEQVTETLRTPEQVGDFRLLSVMSEGGMGVIHLAEQELPRRRVAVKLLRPHLFGPSARAAFHAEVETLALLANPGLPWLLAAGETDGWYWLAMERIVGEPLDTWAQQQDEPTRLRALIELARIVDLAHQREVAHLDLKPANILVAARGVVVLDFGIARLAGAVGIGAGTPGWRAPEQVANALVDLRSDVHALGRLGLLLLPDRPELQPIFARATAGDPTLRHATAGDFAEALEQGERARPELGVFLRQVDLTTRNATDGRGAAEELLQRLIQDANPRGSKGGIDLRRTLETLVEELEQGSLRNEPDAEIRLRLLLLESFFSLEDLDSAQRQNEALLSLLPESTDPLLRGQVHARAATASQLHGDFERAETHALMAQDLLPGGHGALAWVHHVLGQVGLARGDLAGAEQQFREACASSEPDPSSFSQLAGTLAKLGRFIEARQTCQQLLQRQRATHGEDHLAVANVHSQLGLISYEAGEHVRAIEEFRKELSILESTLGAENRRTASCHKWLSGALQNLGRLDEAVLHARTAVELQQDDPFFGLALQALAMVLLERDELDEALEVVRQGIAETRARLSDDFRELPRQEATLAEILLRRGDEREGRELLDRSLARLHEIWGEDHPRTRRFERLRDSLDEA